MFLFFLLDAVVDVVLGLAVLLVVVIVVLLLCLVKVLYCMLKTKLTNMQQKRKKVLQKRDSARLNNCRSRERFRGECRSKKLPRS